MIVAFTKDWDDVPTCTTHILREMAKTIPVLWISSIGTRKPSAASGKDLRRIIGRIVSGLKPAEWKENNLRVLKPILIPKAESRFAKWINRKIFGWYVRREQRAWGEEQRAESGELGVNGGEWGAKSEEPRAESEDAMAIDQRLMTNDQQDILEYWCFVPNAVDLIPGEDGGKGQGAARGLGSGYESNVEHSTLNIQHRMKMETLGLGGGDAKVVYYCADDWTQFHNLDGEWMAEKENELVKRADVVFVTSKFLEKKLSSCPSTISPATMQSLGSGKHHPPLSPSKLLALSSKLVYMPHGVEYDRFATALDKTLPVPEDVAGLQKPVVGFYGNLHSWVDFDLIRSLATARPNCSFVLIGEKYADVSALENLPNLSLLGRRDHTILHNYCRAFDLAIIPYDMTNPRMESVNPVKTKELLAAGLPVVASDVPELRNYGNDVITCSGIDEWIAALDTQIMRNDQNEISARVQEESWLNKVAKIREIVDAI